MTKNTLKKLAATFVASVGVAAFALALAPAVAEAKLSPFIRIVPGYSAAGYRAPGYVYRPATQVPGYRVTPVTRIVPGYTAPGYRVTGPVLTYRPGR